MTITERERAVLAGIAAGMTNRVLANQFGTTEDGVKYLLVRLYRKLGATDRAHAVGIAYELGILRPAAAPVLPLPQQLDRLGAALHDLAEQARRTSEAGAAAMAAGR